MEKPRIKLFQTPNCFYVFDVNKNEMLPISETAFRYLDELTLHNAEENVVKPEEIVELEANGYLSTESVIKEIRHVYTDYLEYFLKRKVSKITLQLTQNCNFRCKYCIYSENSSVRQRSHSPKAMNWETAKKAIDFLYDHSVDSPNMNIGFYGGEPLLEFPLLKKAVEYSLKRFSGKKITFNVTSNATLITDEMIEFFKLHDISMLISLDGTKEINDRNRVFADGSGTYDVVKEHILRIKSVAPEYAKKIQISMVVDPQNDYDCFNMVDLNTDDLERIGVVASLVDRDYDGQDAAFSDEYSWKSAYQEFLSILAYLGRFPQEGVSPIARNIMANAIDDYYKAASGNGGLMQTDSPSGPCIPGQVRLFVNVEELLFPCERVSESSESMCIGTLSDGFDYNSARTLLNIGLLTESECKSCWAFRYCTQCAKKADDGERLSGDEKLLHCNQVYASAYHKLLMHLLLTEVPFYYSQQVRANNSKEN